MSFSKERREQIKRYMLEKIDDNPDDVVKRLLKLLIYP